MFCQILRIYNIFCHFFITYYAKNYIFTTYFAICNHIPIYDIFRSKLSYIFPSSTNETRIKIFHLKQNTCLNLQSVIVIDTHRSCQIHVCDVQHCRTHVCWCKTQCETKIVQLKIDHGCKILEKIDLSANLQFLQSWPFVNNFLKYSRVLI